MKTTDLVELSLMEVWRRILEPPADPDGIPDPGQEFERCVTMTLERVEATVYGLPHAERDAFLIEKARELVSWGKARKMPEPITKRGERWLADLTRRSRTAGRPQA